MKQGLKHIINELRSEGKDYADFRILLPKIKESKEEINKDDILDLVSNDYRIQLHTTPNSIAKLISHLANRNKPKSAIDICCGTGNILYFLQNTIDDLTGTEIVENVALLTSYFIPGIHIITADTFQYPFTKKYDLVAGNIPFGMRTLINGKSIPNEELFIRKALQLIHENGEIILLVPYSVLVSSQFKQLRNDTFSLLKEIISLPEGVPRKISIKSALLILGQHKSDKVIISQLTNFNNLTEEYDVIKKKELPQYNFSDRWNPEFLLLKDTSFYKELDKYKTVQLSELSEIIKGKNIPSNKLLDSGHFLYLKPGHIQNGLLKAVSGLKYIIKEELSENDLKYVIQPGDIVISTIFNDLKMFVYSSSDVPAILSNNLAIIRSSKQDYILSYLQTEEGKKVFKTQAEDIRKGVTIPYILIKDLKEIRIPILPISDLNSLGDKSLEKSTRDELENYRNLLTTLTDESTQILHEPASIYKGTIDSQTSIFITFFHERLSKIENQLSLVNQKLDKLLEIINDLKNDFSTIRALHRDDDEKLFMLCQKIDIKLDKIYETEKVTIEAYIDAVKRWLDLWELLDLQSQKFLPIAEFIFDELSKLPEPDYAPFVLQYCRSIENEILKKLFEAYHIDGLKGVDTAALVKDDLDNKETGVFAVMVLKNKMQYELGKMNRILSFLKEGGSNLKRSKLLQHFREFVINYFDKKILEAAFLNDVGTLASDIRNKAAHPYPVGLDLAKQCRELLRKNLNVFLDSLKKR